MLDFKTMERKLQSALSLKRYTHTMGVVEVAMKMADIFDGDKTKINAASLLHDCVKDYPDDMKRRFCKEFHVPVDKIMLDSIDLTHAFLGAEVAKREYRVTDEEILDAIRFHTTGRKNMTLTEKIVFVADYIEPNRKTFDGLEEARQIAFKDIDKAMKFILCDTMKFIKQKEKMLHPLSSEAYEYYNNL